jgi:hypothetical protein
MEYGMVRCPLIDERFGIRVIERVLRNDASVCGRKNERSFRKMRNLLVAYYDSVGKAVDRIGPEETKKIIEVITEQKKKLRDAAGS